MAEKDIKREKTSRIFKIAEEVQRDLARWQSTAGTEDENYKPELDISTETLANCLLILDLPVEILDLLGNGHIDLDIAEKMDKLTRKQYLILIIIFEVMFEDPELYGFSDTNATKIKETHFQRAMVVMQRLSHLRDKEKIKNLTKKELKQTRTNQEKLILLVRFNIISSKSQKLLEEAGKNPKFQLNLALRSIKELADLYQNESDFKRYITEVKVLAIISRVKLISNIKDQETEEDRPSITLPDLKTFPKSAIRQMLERGEFSKEAAKRIIALYINEKDKYKSVTSFIGKINAILKGTGTREILKSRIEIQDIEFALKKTLDNSLSNPDHS